MRPRGHRPARGAVTGAWHDAGSTRMGLVHSTPSRPPHRERPPDTLDHSPTQPPLPGAASGLCCDLAVLLCVHVSRPRPRTAPSSPVPNTPNRRVCPLRPCLPVVKTGRPREPGRWTFKQGSRHSRAPPTSRPNAGERGRGRGCPGVRGELVPGGGCCYSVFWSGCWLPKCTPRVEIYQETFAIGALFCEYTPRKQKLV